MRRRLPVESTVAPLLLSAWVLLAISFVFRGVYNIDEGWYSLISREVWHGRVLYRDVRFTQTPLLPYLYGGFLALLPPRIESGRFLSLAATLIGLLALWKLVAARYGTRAGWIGLALLLFSRFFTHHCAGTVKTQGLTFALAALCLFFLGAAEMSAKRKAVDGVEDDIRLARCAWAAGLLAGAVVLCRLSFLPMALATPFFFLLLNVRRKLRYRLFLRAGAVAVMLPLAVCAFFAAIGGERFWFGIYGFHQGMAQLNDDRWGWLLDFSLASLENTLTWLLILLAAGVLLARRGVEYWRSSGKFEVFVLVLWIVITGIHATRRPTYPVYQAPLAWAPLILGAWLFRSLERLRLRASLAVVAGVAVFSLLTWPWQEGELYWKPEQKLRTPAGIYALAAPLRAAPGKKLVTLEAGLAFCAPQIDLLPGYEMGEFALMPRLPARRQEYFRGVSLRKLRYDLQRNADFFTVRKRDFVLLRDMNAGAELSSLDDIVSLYEPVYQVDAYGQINEDLALWKRRNSP